jgi:tetratricopeptide (TPR) repeat protein
LLIECSRCHAIFSLHESAAAAGAPFKVQCGRCLAVFEVGAAARPAAPSPAAPTRVEPAPEQPPGTVVSEPPPVGLALPGAPAARRWEARSVSRIAIAALALAIAAGIALYRRAGLPREVQDNIRQGREKLLLDDTRSLQEATRLFTEAVRAAPGQVEPEAGRALALLLQAGALKDLAIRLPAVEREEQERAASKLLQEGAAAARQAMADDPRAPVALCTMALAEALSGAAKPAAARAEQAERAAPGDAWTLYAKAAAAAAAGARDRAVQALSAARQAEPRLLRADVDLASIAIDGGDPAGARELLQRVLRDNPRHDRARRMLSLLPP